MQTFYDLTADRSHNAQRPKPDLVPGNGPARRLRVSLRGRTPNEIAALLLGEPLPTRLDRRLKMAGRQSADVDTDDPNDRPFGRAGPQT
jgi:hypothetical protein